jgi:hypothetical protein
MGMPIIDTHQDNNKSTENIQYQRRYQQYCARGSQGWSTDLGVSLRPDTFFKSVSSPYSFVGIGLGAKAAFGGLLCVSEKVRGGSGCVRGPVHGLGHQSAA